MHPGNSHTLSPLLTSARITNKTIKAGRIVFTSNGIKEGKKPNSYLKTLFYLCLPAFPAPLPPSLQLSDHLLGPIACCNMQLIRSQFWPWLFTVVSETNEDTNKLHDQGLQTDQEAFSFSSSLLSSFHPFILSTTRVLQGSLESVLSVPKKHQYRKELLFLKLPVVFLFL